MLTVSKERNYSCPDQQKDSYIVQQLLFISNSQQFNRSPHIAITGTFITVLTWHKWTSVTQHSPHQKLLLLWSFHKLLCIKPHWLPACFVSISFGTTQLVFLQPPGNRPLFNCKRYLSLACSFSILQRSLFIMPCPFPWLRVWCGPDSRRSRGTRIELISPQSTQDLDLYLCCLTKWMGEEIKKDKTTFEKW